MSFKSPAKHTLLSKTWGRFIKYIEDAAGLCPHARGDRVVHPQLTGQEVPLHFLLQVPQQALCTSTLWDLPVCVLGGSKLICGPQE